MNILIPACFTPADTTLTTPREAVRRTMDVYNFCVQEAQLKIEEQRLISAHSSFQTDQPSPSVSNVRVDIQAYREVKKENMDVNRNLIVGDVPGIEVGDVFNFRHQMAVVGLHHLPNVGIAYGYPDPDKDITATAVACVPKGGYNDNIDDGHSVLYTGLISSPCPVFLTLIQVLRFHEILLQLFQVGRQVIIGTRTTLHQMKDSSISFVPSHVLATI